MSISTPRRYHSQRSFSRKGSKIINASPHNRSSMSTYIVPIVHTQNPLSCNASVVVADGEFLTSATKINDVGTVEHVRT